ncbi:dephospho-CoA kinase [Marinobacterium sp. YM272]|uniref:dephospho-CoA kinase n=1 Tax=Marinobacterium sp. YM272 TaxID=3421654 RepID=UPI003D7FD22D
MSGKTLKVGLTGGIGSGKSAAADMFSALGVPLVDADVVAREVVEPGEPALENIAAHFGPEVIQQDGRLDRKRLRELVFKEAEQRKWLENLLHPLINKRIREKLASFQSAYALLVSPLLIESGQDSLVDEVIVVDVDETTQIERTLARDGVTREQVERILASQATRQARQATADYLLDNSTSLEHLREQVETLHRRLQQKSGESE